MPHSHKKKTLAVKRCLAVGLLAIAAAIGVLFGPSVLVLAQGPTRIDPLADNDVGALQGKYLEADLDTLVGCYAETGAVYLGKMTVCKNAVSIKPPRYGY